MVRLNPYPYLAGILLLVGLYAGHRGIVAYEVKEAVQISRTAMKAEYQEKILVAQRKAITTEGELKADAINLEKVKDAEITVLKSKLTDAVSELRKRPKRPEPTKDNPTPALPTGACTGRTLFAEDSEFLIREASRADKVIIERNYYYAQYEAARKKLEEYADSE